MEGSDFSFRPLRSKRWHSAGAGGNHNAGCSGGDADGVPPPPPPVCTTTSRSYQRKRRNHGREVPMSRFHHPGYCTMFPGKGSWWARDFNPSAVVAATSTSDVNTKLLRQAGPEGEPADA